MSLLAVACGNSQWDEPDLLKRLFPEGACLQPGALQTRQQEPCLFAWQEVRYAHAPTPLAFCQTPDKAVSVLFFGRIFNAEEITPTLSLPAASSPDELLARGYQQWGQELLPRLRGQFAFVLWDAAQQQILAARDPFGTVPLYYARSDKGLVLATTAKQLYRLDEKNSGPNEALVAEYLTSDIYRNQLFNLPHTLFKGVERVQPGHYLTWSDKGLEQNCYWDPRDLMRQPKWRDPDPEQYLELLNKVVVEQCGDFAGVASAVSGGLDSTAILMLMHQINSERTIPTVSMSIGGREVNESENIKAVLQQVSAEPHWVDPDDHDMFEIFRASSWQQECPFYSPSPPIFYLLKKCCREWGMDIVFSGVGADEVLGGFNLGYLADLFYGGRWLRLRQEMRDYVRLDSLSFGRSPLRLFREHVFDPLGRTGKQKSLPGWINRDFSAVQHVEQRTGPHQKLEGISRFDSSTYEILCKGFTPAFLHYETHNAVACGVEHRFPYLDKRLVEYALRLPWEERMSRGVYKVHHRKACTGLLPKQILRQEVKTLVPIVHNRWLRETYLDQVQSILNDTQAASWSYFDRDVVLQENKRFMQAQTLSEQVSWRRSTWRAVSLELWLRAFWSC